MIGKSTIFEVFSEGKTLYTKNLGKKTVYGEQIVFQNGVEYREWDPGRSKISAAIHKGCKNIFLKNGSTVLYLGSASGTTVSHVSDIVGKEGFIFAIDFAPRVMRELVLLSEKRSNIAPIFGDARDPLSYFHRMFPCDVMIQDVAQRDQADIFLKNMALLKPNGVGILIVKARSVDITLKPKKVFQKIRSTLERHLIIVDYRELDPFEKDHAIFICKKLPRKN